MLFLAPPPVHGPQESHHQVTPISVVISSHLCCVYVRTWACHVAAKHLVRVAVWEYRWQCNYLVYSLLPTGPCQQHGGRWSDTEGRSARKTDREGIKASHSSNFSHLFQTRKGLSCDCGCHALHLTKWSKSLKAGPKVLMFSLVAALLYFIQDIITRRGSPNCCICFRPLWVSVIIPWDFDLSHREASRCTIWEWVLWWNPPYLIVLWISHLSHGACMTEVWALKINRNNAFQQ